MLFQRDPLVSLPFHAESFSPLLCNSFIDVLSFFYPFHPTHSPSPQVTPLRYLLCHYVSLTLNASLSNLLYCFACVGVFKSTKIVGRYMCYSASLYFSLAQVQNCDLCLLSYAEEKKGLTNSKSWSGWNSGVALSGRESHVPFF